MDSIFDTKWFMDLYTTKREPLLWTVCGLVLVVILTSRRK
jgi:hypothetical protein